MEDRFLRNELFFGKEKQEKLKKIKVCIVGLGGVGGYAVETLARLGVENFVIIDKDKVESFLKNNEGVTL